MGFLNPLFLLGVASAGIPLLVHLWSRRQARTMDFSTLRFLLEAHRRTVRRFQFEQWLVLALRMLTLACIAIALARPVLHAGTFFADTHVRTTAAIVLDNSASMGYDGVASMPFERARRAATNILRSLNQGDEATLILASDESTVLFDPAIAQLAQVEQAVRAAELTHGATGADSAIRRAVDLLSRSDAPNRELYVISDFTASGWTSAEIEADNVRAFFVPVDAQSAENVAITAIETTGAFVAAGLPMELHVVVRNFGATTTATRGLRLFVNDELRHSTVVTAPPSAETRERISHTFEVAGLYRLRAELDGDRLAIDDARHHVVSVLGQLDVSIVGAAPDMMALALNPTLTERPTPAYTIRPATYAFDTLTQRSLDAADVLILQDVSMGDGGAMGRVRNHLLQGKPVLAFLGPALDRAGMNAVEWMPATAAGVKTYDAPQRLRPAHVSLATADVAGSGASEAVFGVFEDGTWDEGGAPGVYTAYDLRPRPNAVVIARLSDGTPFVVSGDVAGGRLIVVNSPGAGTEWSDLAIQTAFLPLVQQLVFHAASPDRTPGRELVVGETFSRSLGPTDPLVVGVTTPDGDVRTVARSQDGSTLTYGDTNAIGVYALDGRGASVTADEDGRLRDAFAVNLDPSESDLTLVPRTEAAAKLPVVDWLDDVSSGRDGFEVALGSRRLGRELWTHFLLLAVILMTAELFVANRKSTAGDAAAPVAGF
ncbi:VWA domain-containing protein [Candidatus Poribacteria bacterium]|jgi:hypothetical protein|nr:VWA domain-containing protein [Candidatus Poribacteria bacterium]MBT5533437.1 VWA domain-containing protein [Candidatus Poribacteria bacterium]MBT5713064.1 VWA domain-containing protein [Candidatus Poribacteria bacterium]MBT7095959.1 VWA domain-containing protein [Candidatus Poribacteria bacterium]MBT7804132.1 VWA domain-containing protein [Candidatus Poribacteria bacterium]